MGVRTINSRVFGNYRVMSRLFIFMLLLALGLTQSVQAQSDTNGDPDIFLPGTAAMGENPAGNNNTFGFMNQAAANMGIETGLVVYTVKNSIMIRNLLNSLLPVGLDIRTNSGSIAFVHNTSIQSNLPDQMDLPEISVIPVDSGTAQIYTNLNRIVTTGTFMVEAKFKELKAKTLELTLTKNSETTCGQVCVCVGDLEGTSAEELEQWIEDGLHGTTCEMFNNGELDLDHVILSAFNTHPELDTIGIMQTGMNAATQEVTQKTSIIARKVIDEVTQDIVIELEVQTMTE